MRLVIRAARDSMPPSKLEIVDWLAVHNSGNANEVAVGVDKPYNTTNRQLQELHLLGVVTRAKITGSDSQNRWHYRLADGIDPAVLKSEAVSRFGSSSLRNQPLTRAIRVAVPYRGLGVVSQIWKVPVKGGRGRGSKEEDLEREDVADDVKTGVNGRGFTPPAGLDRCECCGFHIPTQGHRGDCPALGEVI